MRTASHWSSCRSKPGIKSGFAKGSDFVTKLQASFRCNRGAAMQHRVTNLHVITSSRFKSNLITLFESMGWSVDWPDWSSLGILLVLLLAPLPLMIRHSIGHDPSHAGRQLGIIGLARLAVIPAIQHLSSNNKTTTRLKHGTLHTLDAEKFEIRLLSIVSPPEYDVLSLEIHTCSLDDQPRLLALSYAWGDTSITGTVLVNGLPFQATSNLVEALKVLSGKPGMRSPLWIDAICINQASIAEKNSQVPLMSLIYGLAEMVTAWLGPEADDSSGDGSLRPHGARSDHGRLGSDFTVAICKLPPITTHGLS